MSDIKLNKRYPESRLEDITDAYTRGFEVGLAMRADENAELRKELAVTNPLFETLNDANDRLIYENMKLRELVRDVYKAFMHGNCYRWCEFKEPCNYISDGRCQWYDRMRELGVNV